MENQFKKLVAVMDSCHLVLYEAQGFKITEGPTKTPLSFPHHVSRERGHGFYDTAFGYGVSAGEPHHTPKEIDHQNSAKIICEYLDKLFAERPDYKELIISAEPKTLGYIREHLSKALKKKITKEIHKDLIHQNIETIEHAIFGA